LWAVAAGALTYCSRRVKQDLEDRAVPAMGVLGAFIFAVQMINFTIPGTGSSGHLGGGLLLAVLLGPWAGCLVMASVLTVQALFFADGGLLALGCNIFNLGILPGFVAYPLLYRPLAGSHDSSRRMLIAALAGGVVALQLGAFGVVLETVGSGISELPFRTFVWFMQPVHLAIGLVEGLATAAVVRFVAQARPEILVCSAGVAAGRGRWPRPLLVAFVLAAVLAGGALSWLVSDHPDGLEWAVARAAGAEEIPVPAAGVHPWLAQAQELTSLLPDYRLPVTPAAPEAVQAWETSLAGIVGWAITLILLVGIGWCLRREGRRVMPDRG
jgi:cobalt/nickel transport system permease protein